MSYLIAPIHVDALVLASPREAAGPMLDVTQAPWFDAAAEAGVFDHNPQTANVSAALRQEPMASNNYFLAAGTHLHWSMPDSLTRGTTTDQGLGSYIDRRGLWFPQLPNRWLVVRSTGADPDTAWLIESDVVHPWGEGLEAVAYPLQPTEDWPHPYIRAGRTTRLSFRKQTVPDLGSLADYDAPLTAAGPVDPSFAALYTACHSCFGLHDADTPAGPHTYTVTGWYGDGAQDPLLDWIAVDDTGAESVAQALASVGFSIDPLAIGKLAEVAAEARSQKLARKANWAVPEDVRGKLGTVKGLMLAGQVTVDPKKGTDRPASVTARTAIGTSPTEAMATLIAADKDRPELEDELEALALGSELKDHSLDIGAKLDELRHAAGFSSSTKGIIWDIRPTPEATNDPLKAKRERRRIAQMPGDVAHLLNQLNVAQDQLEMAKDDLQSHYQRIFSDWNVYMQAAYPVDDEQDFDLDIDLLRDQLLPEAINDCEDARAAVGLMTDARDAQRQAVEDALTKLNGDLPASDHLILSQNAGHQYWRPNDPSIAIKRADALVKSRRHGQDSRGRGDGLMECVIANTKPLDHSATRAQVAKHLKAIGDVQTNAFKAVGHHRQGRESWNAIMVEWEASIRPIVEGSNLRASSRRFETNLLTSNFILPEEDYEFRPRDDAHYLGHSDNHYISGRSLLIHHGPDMLLGRLDAYLEGIAEDQETLTKDLEALDSEIASLQNDLTADGLDQIQIEDIEREIKLSLEDRDEMQTSIKRMAEIIEDLTPIRQNLHTKTAKGTVQNMVTFTLGGFMDRLLMRRVEPQLPIADPLGFPADQAVAGILAMYLADARKFFSPDLEAPFLPLSMAGVSLHDGRVIDSFGQFTDWHPEHQFGTGSSLAVAKSMRDPSVKGPVLPPRSAQPARLNFRWLSADFDDIESNDHPASSPLCGWIVPNDFDRTVVVYDAGAQMLGLVDKQGVWHRAPGNPTAPAGPALIGNNHLARVAEWLTTRPQGFTDRFLNAVDSALSRIDPHDVEGHGSRALLVGRPIAVARARISLRLEGLPANDLSVSAFALRLAGKMPDNHGFGAIKVPIRLGEHGQLNDGLVGYFVDQGDAAPHDVLFAPQSDPARAGGGKPYDSLVVYDEEKQMPLTIEQSFEDAPTPVTFLLDPRAPIHATSGILPTKSLQMPREYYDASMRDLQVMFSATPIISRPGAVSLPLPSEPGESWSWLAIEGNQWNEVPAEAVISIDALRRAVPGSVAIAADGSMSDLPTGTDAPPGTFAAIKADVLWSRMLDNNWLELLPDGRGRRLNPDPKSLGTGFDGEAVAALERLLPKISSQIEPAERHAVFHPRAVAREGWLRLTPEPSERPDAMSNAPPPLRPLLKLLPPGTS